jgi:hypothetical protein
VEELVVTTPPQTASGLPPIPDYLPLPEVFRRVCEAAADELLVERVGVWLLVNHDKTLRCVNLFERSKRNHTKGATLQVADFPCYFHSVADSVLRTAYGGIASRLVIPRIGLKDPARKRAADTNPAGDVFGSWLIATAPRSYRESARRRYPD